MTEDKAEKLNKAIANSFERHIKEIAAISLDSSPASIQKIEFDENQLLISLSVPFLMPPRSQEEYWELNGVREQFASFLMREEHEKRVSNLMYKILVESILDMYRKNWHPSILKRMRSIPQRALAVRTSHPTLRSFI